VSLSLYLTLTHQIFFFNGLKSSQLRSSIDLSHPLSAFPPLPSTSDGYDPSSPLHLNLHTLASDYPQIAARYPHHYLAYTNNQQVVAVSALGDIQARGSLSVANGTFTADAGMVSAENMKIATSLVRLH
jgi:hypothetical protein